MLGAALSVILGVVPLFVSVPVVLPVIGLALAANAIAKERQLTPRKPVQRWLAVAGLLLSTTTVSLIIVGIYRRAA